LRFFLARLDAARSRRSPPDCLIRAWLLEVPAFVAAHKSAAMDAIDEAIGGPVTAAQVRSCHAPPRPRARPQLPARPQLTRAPAQAGCLLAYLGFVGLWLYAELLAYRCAASRNSAPHRAPPPPPPPARRL
jgi:hypothetical protein